MLQKFKIYQKVPLHARILLKQPTVNRRSVPASATCTIKEWESMGAIERLNNMLNKLKSQTGHLQPAVEKVVLDYCKKY